MRVVVIGATGHIGSYLVPRLVGRGYETVCVSRRQSQPYFVDERDFCGTGADPGTIGVYGVLSFLAIRRRREIGLRIALGAERSDVVQMFVRQGLTLVGVGIAGHQRKVVLAEFVHANEGTINRGLTTASVAACVFGFERSAKGANVHYVLAVESSDREKTGITNPKVKVDDKNFTVRRLAWRFRTSP